MEDTGAEQRAFLVFTAVAETILSDITPQEDFVCQKRFSMKQLLQLHLQIMGAFPFEIKWYSSFTDKASES